jgi:hypothetical protein
MIIKSKPLLVKVSVDPYFISFPEGRMLSPPTDRRFYITAYVITNSALPDKILRMLLHSSFAQNL